MIINVILFLLIGVIVYFIVEKIFLAGILHKINNYFFVKNKKYYENLAKYYEKNKKVKLKEKINYFQKISILIDRCNMRNNLFINPFSIAFLGVMCVVLSYIITFNFLKIIFLSFVIALPFFFLPFAVLNVIADYKEEKVEKVFLNFLLQLKNHIKINNDIIMAMREVRTVEPLQGYIKKFLIEISSGIKFEKAIANFREKINIKQIQMFLSNLEHCYLYGGNFSELIDKSYKMIGDIMEEKSKRLEETKGARIVLFILILLNLLVYISFIKSNQENYLIMQKSIIGQIILYWNFISMWILVWLSNIVKKLDY